LGCDFSSDYNSDKNINQMISRAEFSSLKNRKVYFGHQSVGLNIITGLNSLIQKNKNLEFIKIITPEEYSNLIILEDSNFYFIHSKIGQNMYPETKFEDFISKLEILNDIDAAFVKLCYIDINRNTDVHRLYNKYLETYDLLGNKYNRIKFIYFTSPLTTRQDYLIRTIKSLLGRPDHNIKRNQFNRLLRETESINLFDIAYYESHYDGDVATLKNEYLLRKYSDDNRHLNKLGSEKVAIQLLVYLNNLFTIEKLHNEQDNI